jgi:putative acetyltransferase
MTPDMTSAHPAAIDPDLVGEYPAMTKSGGGYFYDDVLEYRVWVHPHAGGEDLHDGDDYYYAFVTFEDAAAFSRETPGAEQPLVLVRQLESINEPTPGVFEHHTEARITEWRVEWLADCKRSESSIRDFLKSHGH